MYLMQTLREADAQEIIIRQHNSIAVAPEKIDCDYYRFLEGDQASIDRFNGEYMSSYSWAEVTTGFLYTHKKRLRHAKS